MSIRLPDALQAVLARRRPIHAQVLQTLEDFEPLIKRGHLTFFPEYTDHGVDHVTGVLESMTSLLTEEAWDVLSPEDAMLVALSALLHDIGLYFSEDSLESLLRDEEWLERWDEYALEVRHWSGKTLEGLLGSAEPISLPSPGAADLTLRERMLVGEFVRRWHGDLADLVCREGMPGPEGRRLKTALKDDALSRLLGFVAKSHTTDLRTAADGLVGAYDLRVFRGAHPVIVMALLRVADYMEISAERAPTRLLDVRRIRSPNSVRAWEAHAAVEEIRTVVEDPESIWVQAGPSSVGQYQLLAHWLNGIQEELDTTWAVLGQAYGRFTELAALGIRLRRVRSNIFDEEYLAGLKYYPEPAAFTAATSRLVDLLAAPLYGARPEIGVRELIQNSVDAVRERRYLDGDTFTGEIRVGVEAEGEDRWFWIEDNGIGMTESQIRGYYLRIGASFRDSDAWQRDFKDASGRSQVLRSGRFGIGALATFLLGEEIEIRTRHASASASEGVSFRTTRGTESVELTRVEAPVGTRIAVKLAERDDDEDPVEKGLKFYVGSSPEIGWSGSRQRIRSVRVPAPDAPSDEHWRRIETSDFPAIHWRYGFPDETVCNGIVVSRSPSATYRPTQRFSARLHRCLFHLYRPSVSVSDPDGRLPLTLDRTALTNDLPFAEELLDAVAQELVIVAGTKVPSDLEAALSFLVLHGGSWHRAVKRSFSYRDSYTLGSPLFVTEDGCGLFSHQSLRAAQVTELLCLPAAVLGQGWVPSGLLEARGVVQAPDLDSKTAVGQFLRRVDRRHITSFHDGQGLGTTGGLIVLPNAGAPSAISALPKFIRSKLTIVDGAEWTRIGWGIDPPTPTDSWFDELAASLSDHAVNSRGFGPYALLLSVSSAGDDASSVLQAAWESVFKHHIVPFDGRRRALCVNRARELWPSTSAVLERR